MSIRSLAREIDAMIRSYDIRPEPKSVSVSTTDWVEIDRVIKSCEDQFDKCRNGFYDGESSSYSWELGQLRTEILPKLRERLSNSEVNISFDCYPGNGASAILLLDLGRGKEVEVFSQFYDSFSFAAGSYSGSVRGYVAENMAKTLQIVDALLAVL